jgi:hypothetical protein
MAKLCAELLFLRLGSGFFRAGFMYFRTTVMVMGDKKTKSDFLFFLQLTPSWEDILLATRRFNGK